MKAKALLCLVVFFLISTLCSFAFAAPDVIVGERQGPPGETVSIPVDITSEGSSAHIQFDLTYDHSVLTPDTPAAGGAAAGHVVDSNVVAPGHLRIVVYSFTNNPVGTGRLLNLPFSIAPGAALGNYPLSLSAVIISDPNGQPVDPTLLTDGSIEVLEESEPFVIPMLGPLGLALLLCLIAWAAITALRNQNSIAYRILVLFVLVNFSVCSLGILPVLAAQPGDSDDDGDIDDQDMRLAVEVILERETAPGDPDCNQDGSVDVLDLPCLIANIGNRPPDLLPPGNREIMADSNFSSRLFAVDQDPGETLTFTLPTAPAAMTCDPATGNLEWHPLTADIGVHTVTAQVTDREGQTDSEIFTIRVSQIAAVASQYSGPRLTPIPDQNLLVGDNLNIVATADDPDTGDTLTFSLARGPAGMTIGSLSGQIQFTPAADQIGPHDVTVKVTDSTGLTDAQAFVVTAKSQNWPPEAVDDIFVAHMGETLTVPAPGVLVNDTDPDGDLLQAMLVQGPDNGTLSLNSNGSFAYTPTAPQVVGNFKDVNQAMWLRPAIWATDYMPSYDYIYGADGDLNTSWLADDNDPSFTFRLTFDGVLRPTVHELRLYGNRGPLADGHDIYAGRFRLLNINNVLLYESEELNLPAPDRDLVFPIPGGPVSDVYRVEFVFSNFEGTEPGFAELEVISDQEVLDVQEEWAFASSTVAPLSVHVVSIPVVGDINDDEIPDIVFVTYSHGTDNRGILRAISGNDGSEIFAANDLAGSSLTNDELESSASIAMGDIDLDGYPEILGIYNAYIKAFQYDIATGEIIREWTSEQIPNPRDGGMSIADIDADGIPEIIVGSRGELTVLNNDGSIRWTIPLYNNGGYRYKFPFAVDLDLDGTMEILSGQMAYTASGGMHWSPPDSSLWDGLNAVGNFDNDPYPEIVLVTSSYGWTGVHLLEHDGTKIWGPVTTDGSISPPTVADFDGDGLPEIGVSGKSRYQVIDTDGTVLWKRKIQDITSEHTGSTVFDFDGDGSAEVVFSDELDLIIFRGSDGAILYRTPIGSGTRWEYPLVADVDDDGHAEIVAVGNGNFNGNDGLHIFGGPDNDWVPTRKIWSQHAYHVTNINDDLSIPAIQQYNWLISGLNNFRMNAPYLNEDGNADQFTYKADDGLLESNETTVFIEVHPPNAAPAVISEPDKSATTGFAYVYLMVGFDPDKDPLAYSLADGPAGMAIDPLIGKLTWAATPADLGDHTVVVSVADGKGGVAVQSFTLTVAAPVAVPDLIGENQADAETQIGAAGLNVGTIADGFHISVAAGRVCSQSPPADSAAEPGSTVNFVLSLGPAPEDVDNDSDGFTENEGDCDDADNTVYPGAADAPGDGIDQDCDGLDGNLPIAEILIVPTTGILLVGDTVPCTAFAIFDDGTSQQVTGLATWNSLTPTRASVDGMGQVTALMAGTVTILSTLKGVTGSYVFEIHDQTPGDVTAPAAVISNPDTADAITAPVNIIGTASDANFLKYTLSIAAAGEPDFIIIHTGTAPVTNNVLGEFDPTLLINDLYTLRLTVCDTGGNVSTTEAVYQVDRELKVGLFTLTFVDLQIPMAGLPIKVLRTYDSRDKGKGDFGVGWRLAVQTLRCRANRVLGTGWQVFKSSLTYQMFPTDTHKVSITLPGGKVEEFDMVVSPNPSVLVPFTSVNASFQARPGTVGTLKSLDDTALLVVGSQPGEVTLTDFSANTFDPQNFRYTTVSGIQYVINKTDGVTSITEENGNTLTFGPGGIIHSAGKSVLFARDAMGRITSITDPNGNTQSYTYNGNGDLNSHTDPESNTTRFHYNYRHDLLRIQDPLGRPVARNEYDADGRLIAVEDGNGNRVEYTHNIGARQEVMTDRLGGITVYEYDDDGNVTSQTDPLGNTTTYTYDAKGNELSKTDPLGYTTTYTYDANNLETSKTDPIGSTIFYNINTNGELLDITDPEGNVTSGTYDLAGNPATKTGPDGAVTTYMYDTAGNRISKSDCAGNTTTYTYDAFGNRIQMTDALGNKATYTYDANGNRISETMPRTTPSGVVNMTTTYAYNGRNQQTLVTDPYGNNETTEYNAIGKKSAFTDKNGNRTTYEYDVLGNLTKTVFPDGTEETSTYNADGRKLSSTDQAGRTTVFEYDALNRPTRTIKPDGTSMRVEYDAAGRFVARIDENGNRTESTYDSAGRVVKVTDALGNETTTTYDKNGNRFSVTDPNGNTTTYTYDGYNRVIKITFADGTFTQTSYAQGCADIKQSMTDASGNTTSYEYDGLNRLVKVIHALGGETAYAYDEVGNRISQTGANGHVTRFEYDHLGRLTKRILPLGTFETFTYDAFGNRVGKTDFNGDTITYTYDVMNRLTAKTYPDTSTVIYTHTPTGQRASVTDARGVTAYTYDALNRPLNVAQPDGATVAYTYDARGNRISMTVPSGTTLYTYDALNRLASVTDPDGRTTTYAYDSAGRRTHITYPNTSTTSYTYDTLNRVMGIFHRKGDNTLISSFAYTLDANGNRVKVTEDAGRSVDYTYDALNRLIQEDITDPVAGGQVIDYTYDPVGNRLSKNDPGGTTVYAYDANDRLLSAGPIAYAYDSNGNQTARISGAITETYTYDLDNRLTAAQTSSGNLVYTYDADGMRVGSIANGNATTYLLDTNRPHAQVIEARDGGGALVANYTYGDKRISQDRSGDAYYYLTDALGSTRALADATENTASTYTYDAFGNLMAETGSVENPFRFAGEQFDEGLEQYYLRARYYDPQTGRFSAQDPHPGDIFNPVSLHRYMYANANPVMYVDPSGERSLPEISFVVGLMSVGGAIAILSDLQVSLFYLKSRRWLHWEGSLFIAGLSAGFGGNVIRANLESDCHPSGNKDELYQKKAKVAVIVWGASLGPLPVTWSTGTSGFATPRGVLQKGFDHENPQYNFAGFAKFYSLTSASSPLDIDLGYAKIPSGVSLTFMNMGYGTATTPFGWVNGIDVSISIMSGFSIPIDGQSDKCFWPDD